MRYETSDIKEAQDLILRLLKEEKNILIIHRYMCYPHEKITEHDGYVIVDKLLEESD